MSVKKRARLVPAEGIATIVGAVIGFIGVIVTAIVGPALGRYFLRLQKRSENTEALSSAKIAADQLERQRVSDDTRWLVQQLRETIDDQEKEVNRLHKEIELLRKEVDRLHSELRAIRLGPAAE